MLLNTYLKGNSPTTSTSIMFPTRSLRSSGIGLSYIALSQALIAVSHSINLIASVMEQREKKREEEAKKDKQTTKPKN